MAEVTVDQTPMARLPYDPSTIPEAVRRRAEAVNQLYAQTAKEPVKTEATVANDSQPSPTVESAPEQLNLPLAEPAAQASSPQPTASTPAEQRPSEPEEQSWHHRYLAMQGRYNASQRTIGEMQEQMNQLGSELLQLQRVPQRPQPPPQIEAPRYLTEQDAQDYGTDLINFTRRAAAEVVAPQILAIEEQNRQLQARLAQEARARLDMRVEQAVPQYREIDQDPRWHRWLLGVDMLSGRVRQQLLNEAIAAADAPRAISFFRGFLNEELATGHQQPAYNSQQPAAPREAAMNLAALAAPGRARPATGGDQFSGGLPDKPIYTRVQVKQLYDQHRRGAYVGREAEWARQDADIIAAGREGRIQ
jgi:hypothetical protein